MVDFTIKTGDTRTGLKAKLYNPSGSIVDLSFATAKFILSDQTNQRLLEKDAVIHDTNGVVWVLFTKDDLTDISGWLRGEIKITYITDNRTETFPNNGYIKVNVVRSL